MIETWEKMSKSKHNGVNPQEIIEELGADVTRLLLMFGSSPKSDINWSLDGLLSRFVAGGGKRRGGGGRTGKEGLWKLLKFKELFFKWISYFGILQKFSSTLPVLQ